jgi:xylulokinase
MATLIGVDVGTSGTRALAVTTEGELVAEANRPHELLTPRPGWTEQDPAHWWDAARAVLAEVAGKADDVIGLGLTGQMHGSVFLDAAGEVIRPALLWNDQRTAAECDEITERVGAARLLELAGNPALTGFQAPKVLWLARHEPDAYARLASVLLPKDYVRLRLTGEHATDASDAAGTLLLDVRARDWSAEILDALEIPVEWMPRVHEGPDVTGALRDDVAAELGLPAGLPVAAGGGDNAAAAVGVGVVREGALASSIGTSGVIFAHRDAFAPDPSGRVHAFCHAVPGAWHLMSVTLSAGGSLSWWRDRAGADFDTLVAEAEAVKPGAEGLVFLPYLTGERTPHADPDARAAFTGLEIRHDRGALVRAVLEGVACGLRDSFDLVGGGERGRVSGGGARSELWLKIVASVLEVPLERLAVEEGAAYGAALLGGVAGGLWGDVHEAVAACVRTHGEVDPVPEWIEPYRALRARYRALYPALQFNNEESER